MFRNWFFKSAKILILLSIFPLVSVLAAGYLDPLFGAAEGYVQLTGYDPSTSIRADGRILTMAVDTAGDRLVGLSAEGEVDTGFGLNGLLTLPPDSRAAFTIAPDGKIIIAGTCDLEGYGWINAVSFQRLLPNGDPDPAFNLGSSVCPSINPWDPFFPGVRVNEVLAQPDGKLLVVASSTSGSSILARFDEHGNLDPLFGENGTFVADFSPLAAQLGISRMILQGDGKILLIGTAAKWGHVAPPRFLVVIRLTSLGQYDPGFDGDGMFRYYHPDSYSTGYDIGVQQNGRIIIAGSDDTVAGSPGFMLGLTNSGAIDTGFGNAGFRIIPDGIIRHVLVLPNDALVTAGFADPNLIVRMFTADGAPYTAFADGGMVSYDFLGIPFDLDLQPNGKIILTSTSIGIDNKTFVARIAPLFEDVGFVHWAWAFVERLYRAGITGGCAASPLRYCPEDTVTRAQMAVFLLRSKYGASYTPPAVGSSTGFGDVPPDYWAAAFIKQLVTEGITAGCGSGNYCPEAPVTRAQMAVFLVRTFSLP